MLIFLLLPSLLVTASDTTSFLDDNSSLDDNSPLTFDDNSPLDDIKRTLDALDAVVGWALAHHYLLIVDFLFSIRVAQGELELATKDAFWASKSSSLDYKTAAHISILKDKTDKLAELALEEYEDTDNQYFKNFSNMVDSKYYISLYYWVDKTFGDVLPQPAASLFSPTHKTFSEDESDACMREILGSDDVAPCSLSISCFNQMTNRESEDYQLTHQLLYFILAQVRGCESELDEIASVREHSISKLIDQLTRKMYRRLYSVLHSGRYDLFAEMIMIGQMLNYKEFYAKPALDIILLWQDSTGCYNDESLASARVNNISRTIGRKLFADEIVDESCSEHLTAIGLIILCLTLRHQLQLVLHENQSLLPTHLVVLLLGSACLFFFILSKRRTVARLLNSLLYPILNPQ